jgi:hypothetical protein
MSKGVWKWGADYYKPTEGNSHGFAEANRQFCSKYSKHKKVFGITDPEKCAAACNREKDCNAFFVPDGKTSYP